MSAEDFRLVSIVLAVLVGGALILAAAETVHIIRKADHAATSAQIEAKEDYRKLKEKVFRHLHEPEAPAR